MVLFYTSSILHPRAKNFLHSVRITGGKFDNRADYHGIYQFWYFSNHETLLHAFPAHKNQLKLQMNTGRLAMY